MTNTAWEYAWVNHYKKAYIERGWEASGIEHWLDAQQAVLGWANFLNGCAMAGALHHAYKEGIEKGRYIEGCRLTFKMSLGEL